VIRRRRLARNRDVALTTLIDLLVQIIFVFALILISTDVLGTESPEPGWVTPDAWKTLISIFDVDPRTVRDAGAQIAQIKEKYDRVQDDLMACDAKVGACDRQGGRGPGNPPCRDAAGVDMVVADVTIDHQGRIVVALGRHGGALEDQRPLGADALGVPLSAERFGALFRPWREHGLARHPACAFKADLRYDARARAGDYEPARRAIANYFTLSAPPRRF
jgi:hypothetical protein